MKNLWQKKQNLNEIKINIKESALRKYNLSFQQIARSIQEWSLNMPSGTIKTQDCEILIRSNNQGYTVYDFSKIPVIIIGSDPFHPFHIHSIHSV